MRAFALFALFSIAIMSSQAAERTERRIALVVGNGNYQAGALTTATNDAGLIAQTLQAAGFDVVGARDLAEDSLRHAFRDFLDKASASGPDTVAFVYFAGYGLQLEGDNYLVPIDANIARDTDVALKAVRVSDYTRALAALQLKASVVVLDAARTSPFALTGQPLAGGLALVEPDPGMALAFNAAPGTVAPETPTAYGPYAKALAEMMREAGLSLAQLFERVRLRVNEVTKGAQVPWDSSKVETAFTFFEQTAEAPAPPAAVEQTAALRTQSIRDLDANRAYLAALERDTISGYEEFLAAFPDDPLVGRVRAIVAARREAITWRTTHTADTPDAHWSYLRRYPRGPHAGDAHRRLAQLAAALAPPSAFRLIDYDVPPPPPEEVEYVDRPALAFNDPTFGFAPPPLPPDDYLPPPPADFADLAAPPLPDVAFVLPMPVFVPIPIWSHPPADVAAPPGNVIFSNIHNTVIIDTRTDVVTIKNARGQIVPTEQRAPSGAPTVGTALPPAIARRATLQQGAPAVPGATPLTSGPAPIVTAPGQSPPGRPLSPENEAPVQPAAAAVRPPAETRAPPPPATALTPPARTTIGHPPPIHTPPPSPAVRVPTPPAVNRPAPVVRAPTARSCQVVNGQQLCH